MSYDIRISGRLDDALLRAFADLDPTVEVETTLRATDLAALYQVLGRLRRSGLEVVQVRQLPTPPEGQDGGTPGRRAPPLVRTVVVELVGPRRWLIGQQDGVLQDHPE